MGSSRCRSATGSNERDFDGKGMISRAFHEHKSIRGDASGAKYSKLHLTGYSVARARRGEANAAQSPFSVSPSHELLNQRFMATIHPQSRSAPPYAGHARTQAGERTPSRGSWITVDYGNLRKLRLP